jgi:hypothetical protein
VRFCAAGCLRPLLHEVLRKFPQTVSQESPRFLFGTQYEGVAPSLYFHLITFELKLLRNSDSLAVSTKE